MQGRHQGDWDTAVMALVRIAERGGFEGEQVEHMIDSFAASAKPTVLGILAVNALRPPKAPE